MVLNLRYEEVMSQQKKLEPVFNEAAEALPQTAFTDSLQDYLFDCETTRNVIKAFQQMGLPAPEQHNEFMHGSEGRVVFLNDYGLVIRIEENNSRINDSPWVLQPIASIKAGEAVIEICPAVHFEPDERNRDALRELLLQDGIKFWDPGAKNMGRLPIKTPHFPDGVPVVIDRPSVYRLTEDSMELREALLRKKQDDAAKYREAAEIQKKLYAPLQQLFRECWSEPRRMERFWKECASFVQQGKLVAGWNETDDDSVNEGKTSYAAGVAHHYAARLKSGQQPSSSSTVQAVRQSRTRPV
jgi:hypothetical protein